MKCKKCGSEHVEVQLVAEQKKRGCLATCMWILLALCTCGLTIIIPIIMKKGTKTKKYYVCKDCGYTWKA